MSRPCLILCASLLSICPLALAQNLGTGLYAFGSYDSRGPDTINIGNLNMHLDIPVFHKAGRGIPFSYDLAYDSIVWQPVTSSGSLIWMPAQNFGWFAQTAVVTGYVSYATHWGATCPGGGGNTYKVYDTWVYHDTFGVTHPFAGQLQTSSSGCVTETDSFMIGLGISEPF